MITWFGYRCDFCAEPFLRFGKYHDHSKRHLLSEQEEFSCYLMLSYQENFKKTQEVFALLEGLTK